MTLAEKHTFIFSESVRVLGSMGDIRTAIHQGYIVMIGHKYYTVLDESKRARTNRPQPFVFRSEKGKTVCGWKFDAREITNKETIKLLNEHKIACLVLNPDCVKEVTKNKRS